MHFQLLWFLWLSVHAQAWAMAPLTPLVFAQEGTSVTLPCNVTDERQTGHWRIAVRWSRERRTMLLVEQNGVVKRGHHMVHRATIKESLFQKGVFSLHIEPVQYMDAGLYTGSIKYGELSLHCQVLLHVTKVTAVPSGTLPETGRVSLTCASSYPQKEKEVRWYHNEDRISAKTHILHGKELTIKQLTPQHSGDWRCELLYENGSQKGSASYHLQVLGFSYGDLNPSFIYAMVGSSIELPCHLSGITKSSTAGLSVSWSQIQSDGHKKTLPTSGLAILGSKSWSSHGSLLQSVNQNFLLHISEVGEGDAGLYQCSFTYHGQTFTRKLRLVTMRVSSSESGLIQEGSRLQLACELSDPSGVERYEWSKEELLVRNDSEDEEDISERSRIPHKLYDGKTLELAPVSVQDAGIWVCSVYAQEKIVGQVKYHLDVIGAQNGSPSPISSGEISFAVVFFFIVLLILVAIFLLAWRNRRRRLSHYPALENVERLSPTPEKCLKTGAKQETA
ncbi:lymphocyte activation gene 3 protein [Microcaecilia unicolor]|uniref:Lymphocyte activation gene 3 protein-like n=1 Tax=Microcaecilia unicolor TaxID=1415580 RepID=A0A6P7WYL4_9AMPH|nr:lymphocyte activation gene 3 protein-like [Microcaecilia unicolor]